MSTSIPHLLEELRHLRRLALEMETEHQDQFHPLNEDARRSARNLLHYLGLRQQDLRDIQLNLSQLGLSSLGRLEAHTLFTLEAILRILETLAGETPEPETAPPPVDMTTGPALLKARAGRLLGPASTGRGVRIMVTMPTEAATDPAFIERLLLAGMDIMRINCAHDGPDVWMGMIDNLRRATATSGKSCRIYADLSGPKLRTGPIEPAGNFVKIRPERDIAGAVTSPARIWLCAPGSEAAAPAGAVAIPLAADSWQVCRPDDTLRVTDLRGRQRRLRVAEVHPDGLLVECDRTLYLHQGARLRVARDKKVVWGGPMGTLPEVAAPLLLFPGDALCLTRADLPGRNARRDASGHVTEPARIGCTLDAVFDAAIPGDSIWFDDGKIGGVIVANRHEALDIRITHAAPGGSRLRAEKGINLPETELAIPALTEKDLADLTVMAPHIDVVGLSFVRRAADVEQLALALAERDADRLGTVLKIETRQGFQNLPHILLAGLKHPPVGVMVARGDLAVELGFERLAEVQEQMLWLCEAAHVPVIWATQVLEDLATTGLPSRAEVTDAAMSGRAECVMLNKGPYIAEATRFLSGVLTRMEAHQSKKRALLRRLSVSELA